MSLRVLVTGTSHCAALRAAVAPDPQTGALRQGGLDLQFAAIPGDLCGDMLVRGGVLTARRGPARRALRRLNAQDRFALSGFDAVAVCGGLLNTFGVTRMYHEARWFPLPSLLDGQGAPPPGMSLVSEGAALAALAGLLRSAPMFPVLRSLLVAATCPVLMVQEPRVSRDAIVSGRKYHGFARIAKGPDAAMLSALYDRACEAVAEDGAQVILQPAATRAGDYFTDPAFRRGAPRMGLNADVPQPADDMLHGNADYGGLVLDQIGKALSCGEA